MLGPVYNASAEWQGEDNDNNLNTAEGRLVKRFPMGPQCNKA
jgi:hypothetical protein